MDSFLLIATLALLTIVLFTPMLLWRQARRPFWAALIIMLMFSGATRAAEGFGGRTLDIAGPLLLAYLPALLNYLIGTALVAAAGFAARKWQIQIADAHVQKAHQAIKTAALAGLRKGLTGTRLEVFMLDQARASSPTAMKKLETKAPGPVLQNIILSKVEEATGDALARALEKALPKPR